MLTPAERDRVLDAHRLDAVRATGLLDAAPDEKLVRLVELTASLLRVPAAQITLVDDKRSFRAAATGLEAIGAAVRQQPVENAYCLLAMQHESAALVGDTRTDPRAQRIQPGAGSPVRAWAGAPLHTMDGLVLGSLCVLDTRPREWTPDDGQVLVALAHAVSAEVALRAASRREGDARARADFQSTLLRATHEATLDGVLVVSPEGRLLTWNSRFGKIWGIDAEAFESGSDDVALASVLRTVVDPEAFIGRVRALYADPLPSRDEVLLRDGRVLDRYGSPLYGEDGAYHGYSWFVRDVSAERSAQQALEAGEQRYRSLVSALTNEVWQTTPDGRLFSDMPSWRAVTGQTEAELLGHGWLDGVHPDDRERTAAAWAEAVRTGDTYEVEYRICPVGWSEAGREPATADQGCRMLQVRGVPLVRDGVVSEWVGVYVDVTELRSSEAAQRRLTALAQAAAESTRVLQEVTAALSGAVSPADVMAVILEKCADVLDASGSGVAIRDGDRVRYEVLTGYSADVKSSWSEFGMDEDSPVTRVIRTGEPIFLSSQDELFAAFGDSDRLRAFVEVSGEQAFARLPLRTPAGVMGALVFGFESERDFSADVQRFMLALAAQCAQALERARLYERERSTARMLQRSLLPEALPLVIGMRMSALCHAASADTDVGGDWYDALVLADGRVALAVGDVRGRGVRAASVMGQVRNALRGLVHADPSPAAVLGWLDSVVAQLGDDEEFVTLVYVVADSRTGHVEWACAGHMPPMVMRSAGAHYLEGAESLPLGLGGARPQAVLDLAPGDALVLFSDGLVENRHRPLDTGLRQLLAHADALIAAPGVPTAQSLRDVLTSSMVDDRGNDDVTVLAVRRAHAERGAGGQAVAAQIDLPARPTSPGAARTFVDARLGEWGAGGVREETLLCISELVTNAVVHAGSAVHLELHCGEGVLRVDVRDVGQAPLAPARPAAGVEDTHGRGLMMVDAVADRWGVVADGDGKVVWFEIALPAA